VTEDGYCLRYLVIRAEVRKQYVNMYNTDKKLILSVVESRHLPLTGRESTVLIDTASLLCFCISWSRQKQDYL